MFYFEKLPDSLCNIPLCLTIGTYLLYIGYMYCIYQSVITAGS